MLKKVLIGGLLFYVSTTGTNMVFADTIIPNGNSNGGSVQTGADQTEKPAAAPLQNQTAVSQDHQSAEQKKATQIANLKPSEMPIETQNPPSNPANTNPSGEIKEPVNQTGSHPDKQPAAVPEVQNQSTVTKVNQSQDTAGNPNAVQHQDTDVNKTQNQVGSSSPAAENQNGSVPAGNPGQSQAADLAASQDQSSTDKKIAMQQGQDLNMTAGQEEEVASPKGKSSVLLQGTAAKTIQQQSVKTKDTSSAQEEQSSRIGIMQDQQLKGPETKKNVQKQETKIEEKQSQNLSTSGPAVIKQKQTAAVTSYMTDTPKKFSLKEIKESTLNSVRIIKNSVGSLVKVVQKIWVNNKLVNVNKHVYTMDEIKTNQPDQEYQKQYDWGTLKVVNSAFVDFNQELKKFEVKLNSLLSLDFFGKLPNDDSKKDKCGEDGNNPPDKGGNPVPPVPGKGGGDNPGSGKGGGDNPNPCKNGGGDNPNPGKGGGDNPNPGNGGGDTPNPGKGGVPVTPAPEPDKGGGTVQGSTDGNKGSVPVTPVSMNNPKVPQVNTEGTSTSDIKQTVKQTAGESLKANASQSQLGTEGNALPKTSTNNYNELFLGILLAAAGTFMAFLRKRA